jgi:hypothetical protein
MRSTSDLITNALSVLRAADFRAETNGSLADWVLTPPGRQALPVRMKASASPPTPSALKKLVDTQRNKQRDVKLFLVVARATSHLTQLANASVVHLLAVDERRLIVDGTDYSTTINQEPTPDHIPLRRRGRPPWIRWAIERLLLLSPQPLPQTILASHLHTTPQAVSKALKGHEYVEPAEGGWTVHRRQELLTRFLDEYPGPGGACTYWYGLDAPTGQITDARQLCRDMDVDCLQTGDIAADHYAPWRMPVTAALYMRELLDFVPAGFSVASHEEYTFTATVPEDPTLWRTAAVLTDSTPEFVDPIIALHDVMHGEGTDALDAAEHLQDAILHGAVRR